MPVRTFGGGGGDWQSEVFCWLAYDASNPNYYTPPEASWPGAYSVRDYGNLNSFGGEDGALAENKMVYVYRVTVKGGAAQVMVNTAYVRLYNSTDAISIVELSVYIALAECAYIDSLGNPLASHEYDAGDILLCQVKDDGDNLFNMRGMVVARCY